MSIFTGDDCQVLLWDMAQAQKQAQQLSASSTTRHNSPRPDSTRKQVLSDPVMAYNGSSEVTSLAWSPTIMGMTLGNGQTTAPGEWLAIAMGRTIKALKV